jgi:branched-chain amino acid transport system substrate-binding protein
VFWGGEFTEAALIAQQLREVGNKVPIISGDGIYDVDGYIKASGGAAVQGGGSYSVASAPPAGGVSPTYSAFVSAFKAKFNSAPNAFCSLDFDSGNIIMDAIESAAKKAGGMPSRKQVLDAITTMAPYQGATYRDPITWDKVRDNATAGYFLYQAVGPPYEFKELDFFTSSDIKKAIGG